jgi:hypothetical protein
MQVGYLIKKEDNTTEQVIHSSHSSREEAHTAALALADSLVGDDTIIEVQRGYPDTETTFVPKVAYNVPPTDKQRNPS